MSPDILVALIGAVGLILSGVLVELIRTRRRADRVASQTQEVVRQVFPNGGSSMRDAVDRIGADVRDLRSEQREYGRRLALVENAVQRKRGVFR